MSEIKSANLAKKDVIVLIDVSSLLFRMAYGMQYTNCYGSPIGGIIGCLRFINKLIKFLNPTKIFTMFDSRSTKRKELFSDYKANRKPQPDFIIFQLKLIYKFFDKLDYVSNQFYTGYEADDLLATFANFLKPFKLLVTPKVNAFSSAFVLSSSC